MRFNPDEYITVAERIRQFYAKYPLGRIVPKIEEHDRDSGFILMSAAVYREPSEAEPSSVGHAYELRSAGHVQAGSYVEVCETSAVGRALAMLGFSVDRAIASREEMLSAQRKQGDAAEAEAGGGEEPEANRKLKKPEHPTATTAEDMLTPRQLEEIKNAERRLEMAENEAAQKMFQLNSADLNREAANYLLIALKKRIREKEEEVGGHPEGTETGLRRA